MQFTEKPEFDIGLPLDIRDTDIHVDADTNEGGFKISLFIYFFN